MSRKRIKGKQSQQQNALMWNSLTFNDYFNRMCEIYMARWNLINFPTSINKRYFNYVRMYNAGVCIFRDEILGLKALPFGILGRPDMDDNPIRVEVESVNGYHRLLGKGSFVIVWSNYMRTAPITTIEQFAYRMSNTKRIADVNLENQKNPKLIPTNNTQRLSYANIRNQIGENVPAIEIDDRIDRRAFEPLDMTVPYITDKLDVHANVVWNEFLTWCGIENSNMDKKERLVASEVMGNYGNVEMSRNNAMDPLLDGLEEANRRFGINMSAEFNSSIPTMLNSPEIIMNLKSGSPPKPEGVSLEVEEDG